MSQAQVSTINDMAASIHQNSVVVKALRDESRPIMELLVEKLEKLEKNYNTKSSGSGTNKLSEDNLVGKYITEKINGLSQQLFETNDKVSMVLIDSHRNVEMLNDQLRSWLSNFFISYIRDDLIRIHNKLDEFMRKRHLKGPMDQNNNVIDISIKREKGIHNQAEQLQHPSLGFPANFENPVFQESLFNYNPSASHNHGVTQPNINMGLKTEETNGISKLTNQMLKRQGQQPPYFYIPDDAPIAELFGFSKTVDRPSVTKKRKYTKRTPKKATKIEIKNELPGAKQEHDSQNTCIACNIESEIAKVGKTIHHTQPKVYAKQRSRKNKATPVSKRLDSTESPDGVPVIKLQQQQQQDQREQCISIASGDSDISYYSDFEIQLENTASRYLNSTQS